MISPEQQAEMLVVSNSKESAENISTFTHTHNETCMNLTNPQPTSAIRTATKAQQQQQQQQHQHQQQQLQQQEQKQTAGQVVVKTKPYQNNNLDAAIVLNVKCHCDVEKSHCISSNSFGFYHQHCLNPLYLYELPTKFSLLSSVMSVGAAATGNCEGNDKQLYLADGKRCWPPPIFIVFISLLEIAVFLYDFLTLRPQTELTSTSVPSESLLIYRPDRRLQMWRFVTYMLLHANWFHLTFNVIVQLLYGLPLEMVHGSTRIAAIYLAGVLAGSLGTSVIDSEVYLVGASGGVYALLAAQLANVMINFGQMRYGVSQLLAVLIFVMCDTGYAFYSKYINEVTLDIIPAVSYIAHLTGSLAGFTIGLLVLINFEHKTETNLIRWLAFGVYASFTLFAVAFNLINSVIAQRLEEEGDVIRQHLLRDLGIS